MHKGTEIQFKYTLKMHTSINLYQSEKAIICVFGEKDEIVTSFSVSTELWLQATFI